MKFSLISFKKDNSKPGKGFQKKKERERENNRSETTTKEEIF